MRTVEEDEPVDSELPDDEESLSRSQLPSGSKARRPGIDDS